MKQLKQRSLLFMLFLPVVAGLGLTSCSGDDLEGFQEEGTQRFSINVTDRGYISTRDGIHTKAVENGYTTEFTAGDKIGVFAVKGGQIITEVDNLCLTAVDNGGTLEWKDASGNAPLKFDGAVYYAYYPYQSSLTGMLVLTATDADGFFANVVSNWTPSTDQGVYTKYTTQDLMTAKGVISNTELSFTMQHEMVLAVIELPGTRYEFSNTNPTVSDYIIDPQDSRFDNYRPCKMTDGTYRYLVKPGSTNKLTGSYTNASNAAKGWEANPAGISFGSYKTFKVDGGIANVISGYNLQVGDYMLKDGSLVSKDATLSPTQKANCIGVVYWIDPDGINHGKIVSLDQQNYVPWGDNNIDEQAAGVQDIRNSSDGYLGTFNLISKRKDQSNFSTMYGAFNWIYQKNANDVNGIWYMPAIDELKTLYNIQGTINPKITSAGGIAVYYYYYLSSTEYASNGAYIIDLENGIVYSDPNAMNKSSYASYIFVRGIAKF